MLLCDEPTSSVDLESDQKVHDMLLALPCTVVVLAHRLHRIRSFDQVVVLDGGRVAESKAGLKNCSPTREAGWPACGRMRGCRKDDSRVDEYCSAVSSGIS